MGRERDGAAALTDPQCQDPACDAAEHVCGVRPARDGAECDDRNPESASSFCCGGQCRACPDCTLTACGPDATPACREACGGCPLGTCAEGVCVGGEEVEPNDVLAQATRVAVPYVGTGRVEQDVDLVDYYAFVSFGWASLNVATADRPDTRPMDTVVALWDAGGHTLVEDDDGGPDDYSHRETGTIPPGTYHVRVRSYDVSDPSGGYSLTITPREAGVSPHR